MRRPPRRPVENPAAEIEFVRLEPDAAPPDGERCLVFEWAESGSGCEIVENGDAIRYVVGPDRHAFWIRESQHVARRLRLPRVYFRHRS